jgi:hypothetical protein
MVLRWMWNSMTCVGEMEMARAVVTHIWERGEKFDVMR